MHYANGSGVDVQTVDIIQRRRQIMEQNRLDWCGVADDGDDLVKAPVAQILKSCYKASLGFSDQFPTWRARAPSVCAEKLPVITLVEFRHKHSSPFAEIELREGDFNVHRHAKLLCNGHRGLQRPLKWAAVDRINLPMLETMG